MPYLRGMVALKCHSNRNKVVTRIVLLAIQVEQSYSVAFVEIMYEFMKSHHQKW